MFKFLLTLFFFLKCVNYLTCAESSNESVTIEKLVNSELEVCAKAGCVRGKFESGRIKPYEAFYGIPYAEPPIGKLRFENPLPYKGWQGYWDATYPRNACIQKNVLLSTKPILGSEDCLYLNVYRPINWQQKKKFSVMVWIHGGELLSFSSSPDQFGPEYLMDNGEVILVTLNYRLGFFGFLCSGDAAVKGNFGLKDQQLALKWVAANIEYFGGDSQSVTLVGNSAGAATVHLQMMNPVSQNLFQRVVLMSGSAVSPLVYIHDNARSKFCLAAKYSGLKDWNTSTTFQLAYQLKQLDALVLVEAVNKLFAFFATPPVPLRPCIEGDWEGAFLQEDPRTIWAEGRFVQKPILIGRTSNKGVLAAAIAINETLLGIFNENIDEFLPIQLDFHPRYVTKVMDYYLNGKDYIDESNVKFYYKMYGDRIYTYPLINLVKQYLKYANVEENPVYIYEFDFESSYSFFKFITGKNIYLGVGHIDDLFYLFTMSSLFPPIKPDSPEGKMVDIFVRTIVNFVTRGEVKSWRKFTPCTPSTSTPFCDRQIFRRYEKLDLNEVIVSVSNEIDVKMVKFWTEIDNREN
ncbi:juvenile hormone esterase-like [Lutzomyia longipalpis]|uniref:juvenile hormone esterase-like n=1 Tax=Lutzomyia longipalpis TaxID=7200 RepID=UPI0024835289|nr:juvenile hormone esterase-like [Lutzomyia longipalpis]